MRIQKDRSRKLPKIVIVLIVVLLIVAGGSAYAYRGHYWPFAGDKAATSTASDTSNGVNSVDYSGPSAQDVQSSQDAKKRDSQDASNLPSDPSSSQAKKKANVGITYAAISGKNLEIRAFTSSVIEGSGTCTATVVMDGMSSMKVTKSVDAFIDATSTQCDPIDIPTSSLDSGTWNVTVTFSSADYTGTSDVMQVKAP